MRILPLFSISAVLKVFQTCNVNDNAVFNGTQLPNCQFLASSIQTCQSKGKIVTISLGGATGAAGFTSDAQASQFANTIWNLFLGGSSSTRPFGSAVLDGCVLSISVFDLQKLIVSQCRLGYRRWLHTILHNLRQHSTFLDERWEQEVLHYRCSSMSLPRCLPWKVSSPLPPRNDVLMAMPALSTRSVSTRCSSSSTTTTVV